MFINNEALNILNLKREEVLGKLAAEISLRNDLLRRLIKELLNRDTKKEPLKIYANEYTGPLMGLREPQKPKGFAMPEQQKKRSDRER